MFAGGKCMERDSASEKKVNYFVLSREIYFCGVSVAARTQCELLSLVLAALLNLFRSFEELRDDWLSLRVRWLAGGFSSFCC